MGALSTDEINGTFPPSIPDFVSSVFYRTRSGFRLDLYENINSGLIDCTCENSGGRFNQPETAPPAPGTPIYPTGRCNYSL